MPLAAHLDFCWLRGLEEMSFILNNKKIDIPKKTITMKIKTMKEKIETPFELIE
jgi:hypothetical protein